MVKNPPASAGDTGSIPGLRRSSEKEIATYSSILAWEISWTKEPGGLQSTKTRPGADCGSDHEVLIAKFRLKLNKIGKTTRPFSH